MASASVFLLMSCLVGPAAERQSGCVIVNVRDMGAKADEQTDDAPAIQAAIDRVSKTGGRVLIPKASSHYAIGRSLVISADNVELDGYGATLRLADGAGSEGIVDCIEIRGTQARRIRNISICGLTIDSNFGAQKKSGKQGNPRGIDCDWASSVLIEGVTIRRAFVSLTFGMGVTHSEARDCLVTDYYDDGFNVSGDRVTDGCHHITFIRCRAADSRPGADCAWEIEDGCSNVTLIDCEAHNVHNSAFEVRSHAVKEASHMRDIVFVRCRATDVKSAATGRGWFVRGWDNHISTSGVTLVDCRTDAICAFVSGVSKVTVVNGRFTGRFLVGVHHADVSGKVNPKRSPHQARDVTVTGAEIAALEANLEPAIGKGERYQPTLALFRTRVTKSAAIKGDQATPDGPGLRVARPLTVMWRIRSAELQWLPVDASSTARQGTTR